MTQAVEARADRVGEPGAGVVEVAERLRGPAEEEHRPEHVEDEEQHEVGAELVGALEPGPATEPGRGVAHPDHEERDDREQAEHRDGVLEEAEHRPVPDHGDREVVRPEHDAVRLDVHRAQDQERPEHEEVRGAGDRPLQQPALAEHLDHLGLDGPADPSSDALDAFRRRLAAADQPEEEPQPSSHDRQGDQVDRYAQDQHPVHRHSSKSIDRLVRPYGGVRQRVSPRSGEKHPTGW